jgi:hypothetical protein
MGYDESYLRKRRQPTFSVFIYRFFTDLARPLRANISKVTAHERIQHLYSHLIFLETLRKLYNNFDAKFGMLFPASSSANEAHLRARE